MREVCLLGAIWGLIEAGLTIGLGYGGTAPNGRPVLWEGPLAYIRPVDPSVRDSRLLQYIYTCTIMEHPTKSFSVFALEVY